MSLDIWAIREIPHKEQIFSFIENESLKTELEAFFNQKEEIFSLNITHNLNKMADTAGFYKQLWHLEGITTCEDLLPHIEQGILELESNPTKYKQYSAKNNWGTYEQFIPWLKDLAEKLKIEPKAILYVSR